ncbi:MAG: hypothetical protein F6K62_07695 [Sphaerospermopsis sp. SIO1G2]|nr:hypothetical protein [Sphaerospermopsis sp. SIO1G2]
MNHEGREEHEDKKVTRDILRKSYMEANPNYHEMTNSKKKSERRQYQAPFISHSTFAAGAFRNNFYRR